MERGSSVRSRASSMIALLFAAVLLALACGLAGCSSEEETEPQSISDGVSTIEVPGSWTVEEIDASELVYSDSASMAYAVSSDDGDGFVVFYSAEVLDGTFTAEEMSTLIGIYLEDEGDYTIDYNDSLEEVVKTSGVTVHTMDASFTDDDGGEWEGSMELLYSGETVSVVLGLCDAEAIEAEDEECLDEVEDILDSAEVEDPEEPLFFDEEAYEEELGEELEEELMEGLAEEYAETYGSTAMTNAQIGDDEYTLTLPGTWYVAEVAVDESLGLSEILAYSSDFTMAVVFFPSFPTTGISVSTKSEFEAVFFEDWEVELGECTESTSSDGVVTRRYDYFNEDGYTGYVDFTYSGDSCAITAAYGYDEVALSDVASILDSLTVANPSAPSIS